MRKTRLGVILCVVTSFLCWHAGSARAQSGESNPYCGLYAVYAAGLYLDKEADFVGLLDRRYLSCFRGSSMLELQNAAQDRGLQTLFLTNMTTGVLRRSEHPIILHVRADLSSRDYDHYVLFVRFSPEEGYVCVDGEHLRTFSEAQMLARWGGAGLIVADTPIRAWPILLASWLRTAGWLAVGTLAVGGLKWADTRWDRAVRRPAEDGLSGGRFGVASGALRLGMVVSITFVLGVVWHSVAPGGLLASGNVAGEFGAITQVQSEVPR